MYSALVTYNGAPTSIVDSAKSAGQVIGFRIVPILAAGEYPRVAYQTLAVSYQLQTPLVNPGQSRTVSVSGPDWVAAFGGGHAITAGEVGRQYLVTVAETCKEMEFVTAPELYGFGASAPVPAPAVATSDWAVGSAVITAAVAGACTGLTPGAPTDGADLTNMGAWKLILDPQGGTFSGGGTLEAYLRDAVSANWTRAPDFDVLLPPTTTVAVPVAQTAPVNIVSPASNMGRVFYRPVGLTVGGGSAGVQVRILTKAAV